MQRAIKGEKGSATIETAVMFLLVLVLVVGFLHLTGAVTAYSVAQTAAREGAREYAETDSASSAVRKAKVELAAGGIDEEKAEIKTSSTGLERRVMVSIYYPVYLPLAGKKDFTLQGAAVFRKVNYGR